MGEQVAKMFWLLLAIAAFPPACFSSLIAANSFKNTLPKVNPFISVRHRHGRLDRVGAVRQGRQCGWGVRHHRRVVRPDLRRDDRRLSAGGLQVAGTACGIQSGRLDLVGGGLRGRSLEWAVWSPVGRPVPDALPAGGGDHRRFRAVLRSGQGGPDQQAAGNAGGQIAGLQRRRFSISMSPRCAVHLGLFLRCRGSRSRTRVGASSWPKAMVPSLWHAPGDYGIRCLAEGIANVFVREACSMAFGQDGVARRCTGGVCPSYAAKAFSRFAWSLRVTVLNELLFESAPPLFDSPSVALFYPGLPILPVRWSRGAVLCVGLRQDRRSAGLLEPIVRARALSNCGECAACPSPAGFVAVAAVRIGMDGCR